MKCVGGDIQVKTLEGGRNKRLWRDRGRERQREHKNMKAFQW